MKEELMISNHWKIFYFVNWTVTANPKRPLWLESFNCKPDAFVKLNTIMSIQNVPLLAAKWDWKLYLHCKSSNDLEGFFSILVLSGFFWDPPHLGLLINDFIEKNHQTDLKPKFLSEFLSKPKSLVTSFPVFQRWSRMFRYIHVIVIVSIYEALGCFLFSFSSMLMANMIRE